MFLKPIILHGIYALKFRKKKSENLLVFALKFECEGGPMYKRGLGNILSGGIEGGFIHSFFRVGLKRHFTSSYRRLSD